MMDRQSPSENRLSTIFASSIALMTSAVIVYLIAGCTRKTEVPSAKSTLQMLEENTAKSPRFENFINLGLEYAKANRHEEAKAAYRRAIDINPGAPVGWNNLCAEYSTEGRFLDAVLSCEKAVSLDPAFQLAANNLKIAREKLAQLQKSLREKKSTLIQNAAGDTRKLLDLGMEFYSAQELLSAIEIWGRIPSSDPSFAAAKNNIASAYALDKNFTEANKAIQEALKREPNIQLFKNNLNWINSLKPASK